MEECCQEGSECLWKNVARRGMCAYGRVLPGGACVPIEECCQEGPVCIWENVARRV
jgi:hypothetical protein